MIQVIRCTYCGRRLYDADARGFIEIKCPRCRKIIITILQETDDKITDCKQRIKENINELPSKGTMGLPNGRRLT